jgi:hypothetical protein
MRNAHYSREATSYLDVAEYIIKEHSPMIKPASPVPALRSDVKLPKLSLCLSPLQFCKWTVRWAAFHSLLFNYSEYSSGANS